MDGALGGKTGSRLSLQVQLAKRPSPQGGTTGRWAANLTGDALWALGVCRDNVIEEQGPPSPHRKRFLQ